MLRFELSLLDKLFVLLRLEIIVTIAFLGFT